MSGTIDAFHQRVSRAIRRGNKYDEDIPGYAYDAVRELEDMENWQYMWVEEAGTLVIDSGELTLSGAPEVKSVRFIHLVDDNNEELPLRKTQRENVRQISAGRPGAFWMKDQSIIGLDALSERAYSYIAGYFQYTQPPLNNTIHWLKMGEELLVARTIRKMQPILRDDKLLGRWKEIEASKLPALQESMVVHDYDGDESIMIPFTQETEEETAVGSEFIV